MRIHEIRTATGELLAFEVGNTLLGRRGALRIVRSIPGAQVLRAPLWVLSWFREEVFCEFELAGTHFEVWEPWGDNSRYWIGPAGEAPRPVEAIQAVRAAFEAAGPFGFARRAGGSGSSSPSRSPGAT